MHICDVYPEFAHFLASNPCIYRSFLEKRLVCIPRSLLLRKFPTTKHISKIVSVVGTVVKQGQVLISNVKTDYRCINCCQLAEEEAHACDSCGGLNMIPQKTFKYATKTQKIRIQNIEKLSNIPETIEIIVKGAHTNKFCPGEHIIVTGIVKINLNQPKLKECMRPTLYIDTLHISLKETERTYEIDEFILTKFSSLSTFMKRKFLIEAFSREIVGLPNVKLGLLLALVKASAQYRRQNIHILLAGDAGTGKTSLISNIMRYISPSVVVNGVCTTDAGLTSCAIKQGNDWALEAGALVLSDMGICCIEAIDNLKIGDRSGLLEAMEQQTLSIAKAGLVSTVNTRCSIIGTCNTKFKYRNLEDFTKNSNMGTALVSRFDLIFGIFDDPQKYTEISNIVVNRSIEYKKKNRPGFWDLNSMCSYLKIIRNKKVEIDYSTQQTLLKYYNHKRIIDGDSVEYLTFRTLESLIRLSEAHAKLLMKEKVDEDDAISAIVLLESCIGTKKLIEYEEKIFIDEQIFKNTKQKILDILK